VALVLVQSTPDTSTLLWQLQLGMGMANVAVVVVVVLGIGGGLGWGRVGVVCGVRVFMFIF